ncbi:MAG: type II secretion system F family protein [Gorillibacterium sp.]|nr:type II secretion system F family protein [Gorillibacterium sp.]
MTIIGFSLLFGVIAWLAMSVLKEIAARSKLEKKSESEISGLAIDYFTVHLSTRQYLLAVLLAGSLMTAIGLLFYANIWVASFFFFSGFFYPRLMMKNKVKKQREQFSSQFRQLLYSLSSLLSAGRSVENAFRDAASDLKMIYPDPKTAILLELERIVRKLEHGENIELALSDLSKRTGLEDIRNFADVFTICKRTGGNLVEIVRRTSNILADKMEVKQDIAVMMAQKRFESRVLGAAPIVVVAFLSFSSPDYMAPLYGNMQGVTIMTVAVVALCVCMWISEKIMDIEI